jgi:hypothetical protein
LPFTDDGDAIAKLDQAVRPSLAIILDRDAAFPKGMAMRKQESHSLASLSGI